MFQVNDIVKYSPQWSREEERHLRFIVLETGLWSPTGRDSRVKIGCLNSCLTLGFVEVVEDDMIIPA